MSCLLKLLYWRSAVHNGILAKYEAFIKTDKSQRLSRTHLLPLARLDTGDVDTSNVIFRTEAKVHAVVLI